MGKSKTVDFTDAVSYGVEMIINTIIYFSGAAIIMLIGFYVLFSAMEEMDIAFVILGFIFIFIGFLSSFLHNQSNAHSRITNTIPDLCSDGIDRFVIIKFK